MFSASSLSPSPCLSLFHSEGDLNGAYDSKRASVVESERWLQVFHLLLTGRMLTSTPDISESLLSPLQLWNEASSRTRPRASGDKTVICFLACNWYQRNATFFFLFLSQPQLARKKQLRTKDNFSELNICLNVCKLATHYSLHSSISAISGSSKGCRLQTRKAHSEAVPWRALWWWSSLQKQRLVSSMLCPSLFIQQLASWCPT